MFWGVVNPRGIWLGYKGTSLCLNEHPICSIRIVSWRGDSWLEMVLTLVGTIIGCSWCCSYSTTIARIKFPPEPIQTNSTWNFGGYQLSNLQLVASRQSVILRLRDHQDEQKFDARRLWALTLFSTEARKKLNKCGMCHGWTMQPLATV